MFDSSYKNTRPDSTVVLKGITDLIGSRHGWFISGSFANRHINNPSDIDVYFSDSTVKEQIFHKLLGDKSNYYANTHTLVNVMAVTSLSITLSIKGLDIFVQLIDKVGDHVDIVNDFDLNKCRKVLFPDGTYWEHPSAIQPLHICNFKYATTQRYFKYLERYNKGITDYELLCAQKEFITTYIADDTVITDDYDGTEQEHAINQLVFDYFKEMPQVVPFLMEMANEHAPELLI